MERANSFLNSALKARHQTSSNTQLDAVTVDLPHLTPEFFDECRRLTAIWQEDKAAIKREQSNACIDSAEREQARTEFKGGSDTIIGFAIGFVLMMVLDVVLG